MSDFKKQIKILWIKLSAYYQSQVRDEVLDMYAEDLADLPPQKVLSAMEEYRKSPKNTRMPLPAQIRALCNPAVDDESLAKEAAARIPQAIRRYGYTNPAEAREFIGPLGWQVVERNGGWQSLCETMTDQQLGFFQAQARELVKAHIQLSRAGIMGQAPTLPTAKNELSEIANSLAQQKTLSSGGANGKP